MPARKDKSINTDKPVKVEITITGAELGDCLYGLSDVMDYLRGGNTSGEVKAPRVGHDAFEFKVTQL